MGRFQKIVLEISKEFDIREEAWKRVKEKKGKEPSVDENLEYRSIFFSFDNEIKKEFGKIQELGVLLKEYRGALFSAIDQRPQPSRRGKMRKDLARALSLAKKIEPLAKQIKKDIN